MAARPTRRPPTSAAQARLKHLEARLARVEENLATLRSEAARGAGAARARLADQIGRAQATLRQSLDSITRALTASTETVGKAGRLTRAVRAGVRAGRQAYRTKRR